ncbi:MAG: thioredoxin-disulfide reductase [Candidatus Omnitrophica bacterium]|nr:thioredoxin-disulfide reductase [Candidatus Omnitrophota bacterium]MCM8807337.1 thioredoxin-disulfide reductase [Candidatus Omnitrophota bacterium]
MFKTIIIGAGPSGLSAGIFLARDKIPVLIIEKFAVGGNMLLTEKIENYPGFPNGITGYELAKNMEEQFLKFGGKIKEGDVNGIELKDNKKIVKIKNGEILECDVLIIATGSSRKKLGVKGEEEFTGKGVSYCAICDGPFYKEKEVAVVGGGDSALEEAIHLTKFAKTVYLIHRRDNFRAKKYLQDEVMKNEKIKILFSKTIKEIKGKETVEKIVVEDLKQNKIEELNIRGIFISVGFKPNTDFLSIDIKKDEEGFIIVNEKMETNIPGIFACGDVIKKQLYQVITACSEGIIAGYFAEKYLDSIF